MSQIAVIGAGIVGLTTALEIQARLGHAVTIYAESLPGDEKSVRYTSPWAGAHNVSLAEDDPRKRELEAETFKRFWEASAGNSEEARFLMRTPQRDFWAYDVTGKTQLEHMPDFRELQPEELVPRAVCGVAFTTVTVDTAAYLPFLLAQFLARGGRVRRASVQHIDQVLRGAWGMPVPDALVVCAGIGARFLGGVEDKDVYPVRGQTVLIRAPWVKEGRTLASKDDLTYVIARRSGDVVLGGTLGVDDWWPHPRTETGQDIIQRTSMLMPELGNASEVEKLIVEHGCGLRPGRRGGIRLGAGRVKPSGMPEGKEVPIVYNYGHGGGGYQASWGSARAAVEILEKAL